MRFVRANGLVVHCLDEGPQSGPPLVFINSLGTDLRIWDDVSLILADDFRIVRYDKRGHGLSESGPDSCEMADYACDLAALLDNVAVARATIVGLSIGGMIAQELSPAPGTHRRARALRHRGEDRDGRILGSAYR